MKAMRDVEMGNTGKDEESCEKQSAVSVRRSETEDEDGNEDVVVKQPEAAVTTERRS